LKIISDQPTPLHADGEILHEGCREITYRVLPGRLPILMP
jgi:diacylglycerol kinase family enzyme